MEKIPMTRRGFDALDNEWRKLKTVDRPAIIRDIAEARAHCELVASPMNNKRLDTGNPCVKAGTCEECKGEGRICKIYSVLRQKPRLSDFTVIIVGERLGY